MAFGQLCEDSERDTLVDIFGDGVATVWFHDAEEGAGRFSFFEALDAAGGVLGEVSDPFSVQFRRLNELAAARAQTVKFFLEV